MRESRKFSQGGRGVQSNFARIRVGPTKFYHCKNHTLGNQGVGGGGGGGGGSGLSVPLLDPSMCFHSEIMNKCFKLNNQRTNGPVNPHLISWPSYVQNIQYLENIW